MRFLLATALMLPVVALGAPPVPPPESVLSTLRPSHPRIMALDEDIARVRKLVETDQAAKALRDELHAAAEKLLDQKPVEHKLIGPRLLHQSRTCLDRVLAQGLMFRLEGDRRFAERAEKELLAAAAFPDWNPSHFLDTAEMSNALGIGYDWLYDFLSPESRKAIRTAIVEKGLKPGIKIYREDRGWAKATHNWNQVCNGGMAVGALAIADEEKDLAGYVVSRASASIRLPTARLAPDGGWDEGPGYWNYAMIYTAYYLAAVRSALKTDFGLGEFEGMPETGLFRIHSVGPTGLTFNYADAGEGAGSAPQMFLFSRLFNRPVYAWHQRAFRRGIHATDLLWYDPRGTDADMDAVPLDVFYKNVDVVFLRSAWRDRDAIYVGLKGGDNRANHSHLDLGTFVLDALGERWASDLGGDEYNMPGYFGGQRWTYYRLKTEGQNTLVINGQNQDPKAKAPIVAFGSTPERAFGVADLSAGYAGQAGKVHRGVALLGRKQVLFQDEIEADAPLSAEWVWHTRAEVKIDGPRAMLSLKGKQLQLRALEMAGGDWTARPLDLEPPQKPTKGITRLALRFKAASPLTRVAVLATPVTSGQRDAEAEIRPLSAWSH